MNAQTDHELAQQIEELKQHLQQDDTAYAMFTKLTQTFNQCVSDSKQQLRVKKEEYVNLSEAYSENLDELASALFDIRLQKDDAEEAQKQLQIVIDQQRRDFLRHQREKQILELQIRCFLRQAEEARTGCKMPEIQNEEANMGLETIQVTFQGVRELHQNHQTILNAYSQLKVEFQDELERAVKERVAQLEGELNSCIGEIDKLQEARAHLRDISKHMQDLFHEKEEYLHVIKDAGIDVPVIQKSTQNSTDVVEPDTKRSKLDVEDAVPLVEEDDGDDDGWLSCNEENGDREDKIDEDESESFDEDVDEEEDPAM